MNESSILCEGYHDRAFWKGWLVHLGCADPGLQPGKTTRSPIRDPWKDPVTKGQFAFHSVSGRFLRVAPCHGKDGILREARLRLGQRGSKPLDRLVINVDPDVQAGGTGAGTTGLRLQDVEAMVRSLDPSATRDADGHIVLGGTKVALIRWEASDPVADGLPNQQTLERLICAALIAVYPDRGASVQAWLGSRHRPPSMGVKEYAWSYMAGWYAEHGCEDFYTNLWRDQGVVLELETRLRASGAWQIAEALAS